MDWKFGVDQTPEEERGEIEAARQRGLEQEYMAQQRWQRMRERERARKVAAKEQRRTGRPSRS